MMRFKYLRGDTFLHRMDPTLKLVWNFVMVAAVLINYDPVYTGIMFAYVLILVLVVARISLGQYVRSAMFFVAIGLFIGLWHMIYSPWGGLHDVWAWGPIHLTREGMVDGVSIFFRILVICSVTVVFTLTTDPARLVESLIQVGHVPYRIGYTMYAVLRFIPLYENEAHVILNAHQIRGVGGNSRGLLARARVGWSLSVPLLVSGIRRARAAAMAMDSRGFGAYDQRTVLHPAPVSRSDLVFLSLHVAVVVVAFYYYVVLHQGVMYIG